MSSEQADERVPVREVLEAVGDAQGTEIGQARKTGVGRIAWNGTQGYPERMMQGS